MIDEGFLTGSFTRPVFLDRSRLSLTSLIHFGHLPFWWSCEKKANSVWALVMCFRRLWQRTYCLIGGLKPSLPPAVWFWSIFKMGQWNSPEATPCSCLHHHTIMSYLMLESWASQQDTSPSYLLLSFIGHQLSSFRSIRLFPLIFFDARDNAERSCKNPVNEFFSASPADDQTNYARKIEVWDRRTHLERNFTWLLSQSNRKKVPTMLLHCRLREQLIQLFNVSAPSLLFLSLSKKQQRRSCSKDKRGN